MTLPELAAEVGQNAAPCPPAAELAAAVLRSAESPALAVVVAADAADSRCLPWLREQPADVRVVEADTDFTADTLTADAAVLLFPCWGIPDPALVERWQAVLVNRPTGTSHVVLDGAEQMASADDRRRADNLVRRYLLPTEDDGPSPAFLWSNDPARPDDRHRL